jgi:hypothetical protein
MSADHQQMALKDVRAGMVLSDNVIDDHGVVLLVAGTSLTASMLTSLARHGVETVPVRVAVSADSAPAPNPDQQHDRLAYLFRQESCNEASSLLHQYVEHYRLGDAA